MTLSPRWCESAVGSPEAVSYTHLDVYKRQGQRQHHSVGGRLLDKLGVVVPSGAGSVTAADQEKVPDGGNCLHHSRLFQSRQHPANAGGVSADVLRQRLAAERASAVAQADQRNERLKNTFSKRNIPLYNK